MLYNPVSQCCFCILYKFTFMAINFLEIVEIKINENHET